MGIDHQGVEFTYQDHGITHGKYRAGSCYIPDPIFDFDKAMGIRLNNFTFLRCCQSGNQYE